MWKTAVGYYTNHFNAGNIHIIRSTSGTNLNPIVVPSAALTPHKPKKCITTKDHATTSKKGAKAAAQPVASGSRQVGASGSKPGNAQTKVIKGKKCRVDDSDSKDYPPLYNDDKITSSSKEMVIDVSDFLTPSPVLECHTM